MPKIFKSNGKFDILNLDVSTNGGGGGGTGTVTSITADAPLTGGTITVSGNIGITQADTSTDGYLSSTDWNTFNNKGSGTVTSVNGTASRISSTGGATPVIDIDAAYVGQTSIITLGTVTTGTWSATAIAAAKGGTGVDSSASTGIAQVAAGTWSVATSLPNGTTATTQAASDNSTKIATTAYVDAATGGGGANTALSNLASVAINTALLLGTSDSAALGSTTKMWSDLFLAAGGVINWNNGAATITEAAGVLTASGDFHAATRLTVDNGFAWLKRGGTGAGFYVTDTTLATNNSSWGVVTDSVGSLIISTFNAGLGLILDVVKVLRSGNLFIPNGNFIIAATKQFYLDSGSNTYLTESSADNIQFVTGGSARLNLSTTSLSPTVRILCAAGTTSLAPLKMQSGTNLTTAEAGAFEYDGTNLLFTKTGTTRGNVLVATAVTTESVASDTTLTITYNGTTYKLLAAA